MRLELTGRHLVISPGLRNLVTRKLDKVHRHVNDDAISAAVIVTKEKVRNVVEITLHARGERFLHAVAKAETWETAMTDAVAKVVQQVDKAKGKWQERKRRGPAARSVKTPRAARQAVSRTAAPVTGGEPASERRKRETAKRPAASAVKRSARRQR